MRSPIRVLAWEIGWRNRRLIWLVLGLLVSCWLLNRIFAGPLSATPSARDWLIGLNWMLAAISFFLIFGIFNYTDFDPKRGWHGFPSRLFALPISTWRLVSVPVGLGVASIELTYWTWVKLVLSHLSFPKAAWIGALLAAYIVFYLGILWTLAGFRLLRLIALGVVGTSFIGVAFLPFFGTFLPSPWFSVQRLIPLLIALAAVSFLVSARVVARQRAQGQGKSGSMKEILERILDRLPRRHNAFASPSAAQFWFEWRRSGWLLPSCVGVLLVILIGPLSWQFRNDPGATLWTLAWTFATPILLALPFGKGFSKPDFWSRGLDYPGFLAVRPLANGEMVAIKMKVAALSAALAWMLVIAFLLIWLACWANVAALSSVRLMVWMAYDHSLVPQYVIGLLCLAAGALLTWRFLAGGLWIGLSGSMKLFFGAPAGWSVLGILTVVVLNLLLAHDQAVRSWFRKDPDRSLRWLQCGLALLLIGKVWLAAFSWRRIAIRQVQKYLLLWSAATLVLIALGMLLWADGLLSLALTATMDFLPLDPARLKAALILLALLLIPFGRFGFAPSALERNRNR